MPQTLCTNVWTNREDIFVNYFSREKSSNSLDVTARIPFAIELHSVGVRFQPAEGGISSLKFDEGTRQFYLSSVRLDVTFEVMVRNLVAYESLTKSSGLIFARYVELMSALIHSAEDVKLMVDEKIVQKVVTQLFSGMKSKSIGPAKIQKLEEEIRKVNKVGCATTKLPPREHR
ncbi:UPF0481 protein [Spatholobus suberectus]|nr:UPF0481 protein [Spatholobus suberectus]